MTSLLTESNGTLTPSSPQLSISTLTHLGLMKITGEQRHSFIQGQVTTDIDALGTDDWQWGAHCDPKGKMLASFRAFNQNDALLLLMPKTTLIADLPQLAKYAVFSQVELAETNDEYTLLGISGTQALAWITEQFGEIVNNITLIKNTIILRDSHRFILVLPDSEAKNIIKDNEELICTKETWQALEIHSGYPNLDVAHQGTFVPQMCNLQAINGISFTKGCYMGQETIARMKYRGGNKRALYIISGYTEQKVSLESPLEIALDEQHYRNAGKIIEYVQEDNKILLTAVLANDTKTDAVLRFQGDLQANLKIQVLPYSLEE
ncbi:tRNA-modifying protein YgfZ [uncultured Shewanella sp.]|uniref:tRNA-modifying protein YgfZ n=1 Tax=uncultured Shewanella sp. TaxID=173975 RepID=UPI00263517E1|nr:tRNA-modifying protein YgfZ [uncultured Shewanella sp.]